MLATNSFQIGGWKFIKRVIKRDSNDYVSGTKILIL